MSDILPFRSRDLAQVALKAARRLPALRPVNCFRFTLLVGLFLAFCGILTPGILPADSPLDERFLSGLRQRRLFTLAEKYCARELEAGDLSPERRTTLALELVQTYAEHALYAPVHERERYWGLAHETATDFLQSLQPNTPGRARAELLVQLQDALAHLAEGELLRQEVQADLADETRLESAKLALRRALAGLETAHKTVESELRNVGLGRPGEGELSTDRLVALQRNISYQWARTLKNQGLCYPADSLDRTNSLSQAVERLVPLAELQAADETIWRSRVELVVCLRLLRKYEPAHQALAKLIAAKPAAQYLLRAMAEKIRLDLDRGQLNDALASMQQGRTSNGESSAELDFAHLETMIDAWQAATKANNKTEAAAWQQRATAQVQLLEREYGAYWMRRAETLLARTVAGSGDGNLAALRRAAESYYRGSRWKEALKTYDDAALLAARSGDADEAFALAFTAASIEHDRKETAAALERFKQLSERMPEQPRAAEAHLMAIVNAAQLAREAKGEQQAGRIETYSALLREHLKLWPQDATADQVRLWLGRLLESRGDWLAAREQFLAVQPESPQFEEALRAALACAERQIEATQAVGKLDQRLVAESVQRCERTIVGSQRQWPEKWSPLQLQCAVIAARLRLQYTADGAESAERVLIPALAGSGEAPASWKAEARLLLVSALATQGKSTEAIAQLGEISSGSVPGLLAALESLDRLAANAPAAQQASLADLELRIATRLADRSQELKPNELRRLETLHAAALVRAGHPLDALKAYEALARKYPRDGALHEAHAALLATATDAASQRLALKKWREVESKTKVGEPRWFRARLAQVKLLLELNDKPAATKLLQLTAVLQPELGGAELKAEFEKLQQKSYK
jgi:hypothetical protein